MTNKTKYILVGFFLFMFIVAIVMKISSNRLKEESKKYEQLFDMISKIEHNRALFDMKNNIKIYNTKRYKNSIKISENKKEHIIIFKDSLANANSFIRKLANSNTVLGDIEIKEINNKIEITMRIKK